MVYYPYISGTGIQYKPMPVSTLVPSRCDSFVVRLMIIPLEAGTMEITGVKVSMFGGSLHEVIAPIQSHPFFKTRFKDIDTLRQQTEQELRGKPFLPLKKSKQAVSQLSWRFKAVKEQPVLEIIENSLGMHKAVSLFQGEKSSMTVRMRNVGSVAVNYALIKITDIMNDSYDKSGYEGSVYQASVCAFYLAESLGGPENTFTKVSHFTKIGPAAPINLTNPILPGEEQTLKIGVYGKLDCVGGLIQINYGHVEESGTVTSVLYTRCIEFQVIMNVVQALTIENIDMIPTRGLQQDSQLAAVDETSPIENFSSENEDKELYSPRLSTTIDATNSNVLNFLLTFDIKNEWDEPFKVDIDIYNDPDYEYPTTSTTTMVLSGVTKRVILPIAKLKLTYQDYSKPLPVLAGKQFTLTELNPEELLRRTLFWYRQLLIGGLDSRGKVVLTWKFVSIN